VKLPLLESRGAGELGELGRKSLSRAPLPSASTPQRLAVLVVDEG